MGVVPGFQAKVHAPEEIKENFKTRSEFDPMQFKPISSTEEKFGLFFDQIEWKTEEDHSLFNKKQVRSIEKN